MKKPRTLGKTDKNMDNYTIGQIGEKVAKEYLIKKGYKILATNYVYYLRDGKKLGEIDIVAKDKKEIVFVEVKSQDNLYFKNFDPADKINPKKLQTIKRVGEIWLRKNKFQEKVWRIDVLSVFLNFQTRKARIYHFQNV